MPFIACELKIDEATERFRVAQALRESGAPGLVLETCQRLEFFGFQPLENSQVDPSNVWNEAKAFERLARIAAGLESRMLGELEILGQVRQSYKTFHISRDPSLTQLDRIFQQAISLARRARRQSGIDRNLTSLASIAARHLIDLTEPGKPLAVIGAGSIAGSAARYLSKRGKSPLRVVSRCPDRAATLALEIGGFGTGLDGLQEQLKDVHGILCATAAPHPVVYDHHIEVAGKPLTIIDLGEPSDCHQDVLKQDGLDYIDLLEIEKRAHVNSKERWACAEKAEQIIRDGAVLWSRKN